MLLRMHASHTGHSLHILCELTEAEHSARQPGIAGAMAGRAAGMPSAAPPELQRVHLPLVEAALLPQREEGVPLRRLQAVPRLHHPLTLCAARVSCNTLAGLCAFVAPIWALVQALIGMQYCSSVCC